MVDVSLVGFSEEILETVGATVDVDVAEGVVAAAAAGDDVVA